jgi:hypothetical protein
VTPRRAGESRYEFVIIFGWTHINSYFYIKCAKRVFFVHEKVFYAETKVEAV